MTHGENVNSWLNIAILAVAIYIAVVQTRTWLELRARRNAWGQVASMLELVKGYFQEAKREHAEAANELRPVINGAKDAMEALRPAVAEAKESLTVKKDGADVPIGEYVQQNTHDFRDGLQRILTAVNRLEMLVKTREPR